MQRLYDFLYKILHKETGNLVMGALTDAESYKVYVETLRIKNRNMKNKSQEIMKRIEEDIEDSVSRGIFYGGARYNRKSITKEQLKYILNYYREKGYKVKCGYIWNEDYNRHIVIRWKHWGETK